MTQPARKSARESTLKARTAVTSPARQLEVFISKFEPAHQRLIRALRSAMRKRFPTANELVYDNYNFFVIGYGPTERPSECFLSIAAAANGVGLAFLKGASLPDPMKLLQGSGKLNRFLRLTSVRDLDPQPVQALLTAAARLAKPPLAPSGRGKLIIRSVSAKQRPRSHTKATVIERRHKEEG